MWLIFNFNFQYITWFFLDKGYLYEYISIWSIIPPCLKRFPQSFLKSCSKASFVHQSWLQLGQFYPNTLPQPYPLCHKRLVWNIWAFCHRMIICLQNGRLVEIRKVHDIHALKFSHVFCTYDEVFTNNEL